MADGPKDRGVVERLALERIRKRHRQGTAGRLADYLAERIAEEEGNGMGTSEIIEKLIEAIAEAEARGVTKNQLAVRTGIPRSTLTRLMNRERESLKVETVEKLCEALGLKLEISSRRQRARKG